MKFYANLNFCQTVSSVRILAARCGLFIDQFVGMKYDNLWPHIVTITTNRYQINWKWNALWAELL